uniref:Uncharacterized protein LOC104239587 n=1 Tax=Nicotiana sylvestris TaxID=4096 RepID=A0A1U7Y003_NICSY|nr:PREDICTED: uncharacterized protein LOC104239587 [Nicotiana sylvestris]
MTGIPAEVAIHKLSLDPDIPPGDHLKHFQKTFDILRKHNMKLNLEKYALWVSSCKFLGFLVSQRGIEVYFLVIREMPPFLHAAQKEKQFRMDLGMPVDFERFKKLALALVVAARKLRPYFQYNLIVVVTTFLMRKILHKPELSGRLAKWAVEMSEFDIEYKTRTAIKSQVLADFVADFSLGLSPLATKEAVMDWRNEIIDYIEQEKLPEDSKASWALRVKAARYNFKGGQLYGKSFQGLLARCLGASEVNYVMREVHEGLCRNHSCTDSLVLKLVHQPAEPLHLVLSPWPFIKWGMDIVKPLPSAPGKAEEGPFQKMGEREVVDFLWENIICRLEAAKGKWHKELPGVLWAYRTTAKLSTGETPFSLVYEAEALIPVEVGEPTLRYFQASEVKNNKAMLVNLELLDEHRDLAHIRMAAQK